MVLPDVFGAPYLLLLVRDRASDRRGAAHAGFVEGVAALSKSAFVGGVYLAGGCLWSLESVWSLWTLQRAYATFRGHGADRRLKAELQAAGADAAAVAAGAAIRGGAGGGRV